MLLNNVAIVLLKKPTLNNLNKNNKEDVLVSILGCLGDLRGAKQSREMWNEDGSDPPAVVSGLLLRAWSCCR